MARTNTGSEANYFSGGPAYNLPTNCTILFRAKTSSDTGQNVMGRRATGGWGIYRESSDNSLGFVCYNQNAFTSNADSFPSDGNWHAFAITKSGTSFTFYVDNTTAKGTATSAYDAPSYALDLFIGNHNNDGSPYVGESINGSLAEVALFSRVLDSTDLGLYMSGSAPTNYSTSLDHYWKLDNASAGNESATTGGVSLTEVGSMGYEAYDPSGGASSYVPTNILIPKQLGFSVGFGR